MKQIARTSLAFAVLSTVVSPLNAKSKNASSCSAGSHFSEAPLFTLDGQAFSRVDMPKEAQSQLFELDSKYHQNLKAFTERIAVRIYLAKKKKKWKEGKPLPALEDLVGGAKVSDKDAKKFYEEQRLSARGSFAQLKPQIKQYLQSQAVQSKLSGYIAEMKSKGGFSTKLIPPSAPEVSFKYSDLPSKGPKKPKVTVVEVADFLCSHCRSVKPTIDKLTKKYSSKVRFAHAQISLQPNSFRETLTEGAYCAYKLSSSKYWKYSDAAFAIPFDKLPKAKKDYDKKVTELAVKAGYKKSSFAKCLKSNKGLKKANEVKKRAEAAGFTGTPTFYVGKAGKMKKVNFGELEEKLKKLAK